MLILPVEEARTGMTLAMPVTHPDHPDQDLLKGGYVLEENTVQSLRDMSVAQVFVEFPGLDELDHHLAPNLSPARQTIYGQIKAAIGTSQSRARPAISYSDYYASIREMILTLLGQGQHPIYMEHMSRMGGDAVAHATAVSHLSLLLGIKLERYLIAQRWRLPEHHAKEVVNIGVAGMLHDIGKLALPESLQSYTGVEPPPDMQEMAQWQEHTHLGYDMIHGGVEPSAAAAVLHHHQHFDGSGFPATTFRDGTKATPKESRIHIFARIVTVADLYDRLATPMAGGNRRTNLEILHLLRTRYAGWCDPMVLKALEAVTPPFPPGAIVTLSDHSSAVVVDVNPQNPFAPVVRRVIGPDLQLDDTRLDLSGPGTPLITHIGKTPVAGFVPIEVAAVE